MKSDWQAIFRDAVTSVEELVALGLVNKKDQVRLKQVVARYPLRISRYYLNLIDKNDPQDPLAKMAIPSVDELQLLGGFVDPIGDLAFSPAPGLTHRYPDRALLHISSVCAMNCRFCFRKNLLAEPHEKLYRRQFDQAFVYLQENRQIKELILTGGDPFMQSDDFIESFLNRIMHELTHVQRVRIHSRVPVTFPRRITAKLMAILVKPRSFNVAVVTHFNHPRELSTISCQAVEKLVSSRVLVLNQTVLLKGVNDSERTMIDLFNKLGKVNCLPYYLHHCDQAVGNRHFYCSIRDGRALFSRIQGQLSGYLIPRYVVDLPNGQGKFPVMDYRLQTLGAHTIQITRADGVVIEIDEAYC